MLSTKVLRLLNATAQNKAIYYSSQPPEDSEHPLFHIDPLPIFEMHNQESAQENTADWNFGDFALDRPHKLLPCLLFGQHS